MSKISRNQRDNHLTAFPNFAIYICILWHTRINGIKTSPQTQLQLVQVYLVIHNDHVSTEEVVVCNDASEPLGGRVLSVHTHAVAIQGIGAW